MHSAHFVTIIQHYTIFRRLIMLNYTLYPSTQPKTHIIYIHGGGYVIGDRHDLPQYLIDSFNHNNINLYSIDYPLAPQVTFSEIITSVYDTINSLIQKYDLPEIILFGRSAGANIILNLDPAKLNATISKLILFYGYPSLDLQSLQGPVNNLDMPAQIKQVETINTSAEIMYERNILQYYSYYYSLRKLGQWITTVGMSEQAILFPVTTPIYIAHSIFDPDVPYKYSNLIKQHFEDTTLYTSTLKVHAIDHDEAEYNKFKDQVITFINTKKTHF